MTRAIVTELEIRNEAPRDIDAIRALQALAFPTPAEAALVDKLRDADAVCASLVACAHEVVSGHALFSKAHLYFNANTLAVAALGPIAILPVRQRAGIGGALIRHGIERCTELSFPAVIVLGHPGYYSRFGFQRADTWDIRCEFAAPPEAFMIKWLAQPERGPALAKYHPAFSELGEG
jgi:putative acetyltransferase